MVDPGDLQDLLRHLGPEVLAALVRRYGTFDVAEEATQEALIAAASAWARDGAPEEPRAWLVRVARRRAVDLFRAEAARQRREAVFAQREWTEREAGSNDPVDDQRADDTALLLFLCCHPALSATSQVALTLRAVGGLTTSEVARALLVSDDAVARRITRAKQTIRESGVRFAMPQPNAFEERLDTVLRVLYLIFTEGYVTTAGPDLQRRGLAEDAIRLTRQLLAALRDHPEVTGLLALLLLTHARSRARQRADGTLVPMADQDRGLWDRGAIAEGLTLLNQSLGVARPSRYRIQAAIAALHDEAASAGDTNWAQIAALYRALGRLDPSPVVALNHAVAVSMAEGSERGLVLLEDLRDDPVLREDRRFHAVRGHLLERTGDLAGAQAAYAAAAERARNQQQQRYLNDQVARLRGG